MSTEDGTIEVKYEGFTPDQDDKEYIQAELTKVLECCPYDSSITSHIFDHTDRYAVEILVRHQLGQFRSFGEEVSLSEAMNAAIRSIFQQLEYWRETRFKDMEDYQKGIDVLLVDDDPISVKLLESCFRLQGCRTKVASDGMEAIEDIGKRDFDLVVMDWNMPDLNGRDTLRAIDKVLAAKNAKSKTKTPVITYSVCDKKEIRFPRSNALMQLGHLPKATSFRILKGVTKSFLGQLPNFQKTQQQQQH